MRKLIVRGDTQLVVRQVNKDYQSPLMEAYVEEVRKFEERFDGLRTEHVPHAKNTVVDELSKHAALKLPVEPGTFVLRLTQPSVTPSTKPEKRRKLSFDECFPVDLPRRPSKDLARKEAAQGDTKPARKDTTPAEDMPLVLVVEPQAPAWAQHIVRYLQTGDLPEEQEEVKRVARQSSMYQFVDDALYKRPLNDVKLKCIPQEDGLELLA